MLWEEACRTLGVTESATQSEIKEQYLYKVQLLHPDKTLDKPEKVRQKAEEELGSVNVAYSFLSNERNNPFTPPKLEIVPSSIRFVDVDLNQKKTTTIEISNVGGPFTNCWVDNSPAPWLSVTGVKATTSEALPLLVTIEALGIPSVVQTERCSILVKLKNEKTGMADESSVNVEIVPSSLSAKLKIKKGKHKFHKIPQNTTRSSTLEIYNTGDNTLHGFIKSDSPWLTTSKSELMLPRMSVTRCIISVNTDGLVPGFYDTGHIKISTNGGEATVTVELTIDRQSHGTSHTVSAKYKQDAKVYGGMQTIRPAKKPGTAISGSWVFSLIVLMLVLALIALLFLLFSGDNTWWEI